ncbi:MAG: MFS transporter, partial [Bordetella sp.]|uniref:MFS transporter n=1 Tax=Bordetella sp. TaxID=28081 RepID=UPI003F7C5140
VVGILRAGGAFFTLSLIGQPVFFLDHTGAGAAAPSAGGRSAFKPLVADAAARRASLGVVILTSVQNFGYYGVMIWMPAYLSNHFGYTLTKSAAWTAITVVGMAAGIWLFGQLADRIGRRPVFLAYQVGAALSVLIYAQLQSEYALLVGGAIMGMFVNGMLGGYGALISELYPTQARATAQNVLFNIGRAVGGFGPLVVGALAVKYSFSVAIALLAVLYAIDILATLFLIPERKGLALQ